MLIDAHSHLDRFEEALEEALQQIRRDKILTVSNSMDLPSYTRNLEIGQMCDFVLPCFGVHPWNAPIYADHLTDLDSFLERTPILGEIGMDHHYVEDASHYPAQQKVFEYSLAAAHKQDKIVILHTKGAERMVLDLLAKYKIRRAVVHWYSGPRDIFHELVARGVYFTIGIEVIQSEQIQRLATELPSERLLTETDNPGGPRSITGRPGMPALLKDVIRTLAGLRKVSEEDIVQIVETNFTRLTGDDPRLSTTLSTLCREEHRSV